MSDLNALERDVEQARARFAGDLARLRSPTTVARFKDDAWAQAVETKDELIDKTKDAARDGAQRLFTDLKERAAANPVAALAIGAGLAWRLVHRPPIATLLVGMGVVGLLRTSPARSSQPYMGLHDEDPRLRSGHGANDLVARAGELAEAAKEKAQDWGASAGDAARATATRVADTAAAVTERASRVAHDASDAVRGTASQIADKAASVVDRASDGLADASHATRETVAHMADKAAVLAQQASHRVYEALPDKEDRDTYLLGAAALAVAAAVGIAYQRRSHHEDIAQR